MARPKATQTTEDRVARLVHAVLRPVISGQRTVAELAKDAGLAHETVRQLLKNPAGRPRYGPGFFIVAALARAQRLSLDDVAAEAEEG